MTTRSKLLLALAALVVAAVSLTPWWAGGARVAVPVVGDDPTALAGGEVLAPLDAPGPGRVVLEAPPAASGTKLSDPVASTAAPPPPRPGDLRVDGRVTIGDELAVELVGSVRVHLGDPSGSDSRFLGAYPVRAGRFGLLVRGSELRGAPDARLAFTLVAPGYELTSASFRCPEQGGGVFPVRLDTSPGAYLVRGRIVTRGGDPVPSVEVLVAAFGPLGASVASTDVQTEVDGTFRTTVGEPGHVTVVAHHLGHGVATSGGRLEAVAPVLELGDLVLSPLGVVEGTLRGAGGAPLRRYGVTVTPVDGNGDLEEQDVRTDDAGRFRFACLERVPYRVEAFAYDLEDIEWPVVTPDALDVELHVPIPSAHVIVLGPGGAPAPEADLGVASLRRSEDGRGWGIDGQGTVTLEKGMPGSFHLTFSQRGRFSLGAVSYVDGQRWVAHEQIDVERSSIEVKLQLAPELRRELSVAVEEPGGALASDWRVSFVDADTGLHGSLVRSKKPVARLADGRWLARVVPAGTETMVLPFEHALEIGPASERITLRAPRLGGRLTVSVDFADPRRFRARVQLSGHRRHLYVEEGKPGTFGDVLEPGELELWVQGAEASTRRQFTVRAGETTHVRVAIP